MIGSSSLSGDTLIACHFPVVQLPTWQLPVQALCSSAKRSGRLCTVGLTRAVSLPEQDSTNREQVFTGGRRHFSSSYGSLNEDRAEEEGTSDSSGRHDSTSSSEETSCCLKKGLGLGLGLENSEARGSVRSHNSFLPTTELDEEDEDSDGDNLHRYLEDSSFVLHGNSNWPLSNGAKTYTVPQGDLDSECAYDGTVLGTKSDQDWLSSPNPYQLDSLHSDCQCFQANRSGITIMACEEQDSDRLKDNMTCCLHSPHDCSQELLSNTEYISDSSCNSSDGILVNFCTMYNRSNNPVTPHDLSSPALHPSQSCEGSVFLNLHPVQLTPTEDRQQDDMTVNSPQKELVDVTPSASCWSPQGLDSNFSLYSLEPVPPGLSSLEVSDLTACLQTQTTMAMETNQKYYKLVTCDLSSQSPSPAWSSLTDCPDGQSRGSQIPPSEHLLNHYSKDEQCKDDVDQLKEKLFPSTQFSTELNCSLLQTSDDQVATTSTGQTLCRKNYTASQCSPHSSNCQDMCSVSTQPSVISNEELSTTYTTEKGACSLENGVVRYSKAQRPTSLPIQPFVLIPADKSQSQTQHLGCLLEQYINQKSSKFKSFQPVFNGKNKTSLCFSNLQPSPMGSYCPILLEAPSSTDTCSTCTPSPECFSRRRTWCQFSRSQEHLSQCTSKSSPDLPHCSPNPRPIQVQDKRSPGQTQTSYLFSLPSVLNQSNLVKIPTFQNLINLSPEQSHVKHKHQNRHDSHSHTSYHPIFSHTPPILPVMTDSHHPNFHVSSSPPTFSPSEDKFPQHRAAPAVRSGCFHSSVAAALSSVASLSSLSSLLSVAASGLHVQEIQGSVGPCGKHSLSQQSEALMLSDRPPTEFCLSPDTSYESLSISHLQRRGLLRSVSRAVDLIMVHFGNSRDPEEKMRLGNSSGSPTIAGLVLKHLCPAIQRILEDGLKDHNLDLIIGQHRNHPWTLVEVSTRIPSCSSTRVLHSLVSKIQQCSHLTSHCMRLRAFLIGLLNLRGLEFWLSLLHSQKNVVTTYYYSWGFLSMSLGRCQPLFQELLLLLQPLSMLPFNLNLLLEPRLLCNSQLFSEEKRASPPEPCSAFLVTSWPQLPGNRKTESNCNSQQTNSHHIGLHCQESLSPLDSKCISQHCGGLQATRIPWLASVPQWWQKEPDLMDGVAEGEDCSLICTNNCSLISMSTGKEKTGSNKDSGTPHVSTCDQMDSPSQSGLRWAKLFGAADTSTRDETASQGYVGTQTRRRPSEWLHLDRSQLGLLAQSIKSMKLVGSQINKND